MSPTMPASYVPVTQRTITSLARYLILIPLLAPKGLEEVLPAYKPFITAWAMLALVLIVFDGFVRLLRGSGSREGFHCPAGLIAYFIVAFITSAFSAKGIVSGLQELFFFPAAFLYLLSLEEWDLKSYCRAAAYILIVLFALQLSFSRALFAGAYHMTLLGHVQAFSQYGMLAYLLAFLLGEKEWASPALSAALLVLASACMITVDADSAHYALVVFAVIFLILKVAPVVARVDQRIVVIAAVVLSIAVVHLTITRQSPLMGTNLDWTFSGRYFVWQSAYQLFQQSPVFGYGVENPVITTFWSLGGMSYAHNQVLQSLLDGGIVLFVAMVWLLCSVASCVNKISDIRVKRVSISVLCALLFVMLFDSFTPYSYAFIALALMAREGLPKRKEAPHGPQRR